MISDILNPEGNLPRREFLFRAGGGFLGTAIAGLLQESRTPTSQPHSPEIPARARSVIFLFMCGGVSHIDTFDPKDNKWAGTLIDAVSFGDNLAEIKRPVIPCRRTFTRRGQSGIPVSDWFPHVGGVIDDIALIRSMWCHETNHFPAVTETATGHRDRILEHPSFGSWIAYALGSENRNLPTFVSMGRPSSPLQLSGGYLGAGVAATPFLAGPAPIRNLKPPTGSTPAQRERQMRALEQLNQSFRNAYADQSAIAARLESYALAGRMQLAAPEACDVASESDDTRALYGVGETPTDDFGKQLILARRLVERGVRFVQVCHAGGGNGAWDSHGDMETHAPLCRQVDKPIAGLLRDLKQRGLLESTLVVWTSEFGRSPWSQNTTGRDHNPRGYCSWMAGGGVRGGTVWGSTDDVGYRAVQDPVYVSDLQATILQQMGIDHHKLEVEIRGRPVRLIEPGSQPVQGLTL